MNTYLFDMCTSSCTLWVQWALVGIVVVVIVEVLMIPLLHYTIGTDVEIKGVKKRVLPNAPLVKALARIVYVLGAAATGNAVYQTWGGYWNELGASDILLGGLGAFTAFGTRWFAERWRIAVSHRLVPGISVTIYDGGQEIHRMICSVHLNHVMVDDPRSGPGEDITRIPMSWFLGKAVTNHGPHGKQFVVRHQIKTHNCDSVRMANLYTKLNIKLPEIDTYLNVLKIGWVGEKNLFEIRVRIERTNFQERDEAYREVAQEVMDAIKEVGLEIHDQNQ